jgi:hypothetical protein
MAVFDTRRAACESAGMTTARNTALISVLVAGCGGAGQGSPAPLETARNGQQHEVSVAKRHVDNDEMIAMTPEVKAFHDALAPRWHAEHGAKRMADTCAAVPELRNGAEAIAKATPPERAEPADWTGNARQLGEAVTALGATCQANDADKFEPAFAAVHERFHAVLEASMGGEHGEPER